MSGAPAYESLVDAWRTLAAARGFEFSEYSTGNPARSLFSVGCYLHQPHRVFIGAGVHGDEPAPPWALLQAVEANLLDPRYSYRLWGCTNPSGYMRGTRRNCDDIDINRSYAQPPKSAEAELIINQAQNERYILQLDMHEDFEADGVYLYEPMIDNAAPLGRAILDAMINAGYPLQIFSAAFDLGYTGETAEDLRQLEPGRVIPDIARECEHFADGLPLTMYFLHNGLTKRSLTIESPRRFAWGDRIAIHRIALVEALAGLGRLTHAD